MIKALAELYSALTEYAGPGEVGDLVSKFDDATCEALYRELVTCGRPLKLVRPLWFNYETQQFRFECLETSNERGAK